MKKLQPKNPRNFTEIEVRLGFVLSKLCALSDGYVAGMNLYMDGVTLRVPHTLKEAENNAALDEFLCSAMLARKALEVFAQAHVRVSLSFFRQMEINGDGRYRFSFRTPADMPNGKIKLSTLPHVDSSIPLERDL